MKKIIVVLLAVIGSLFLTACDGETEELTIGVAFYQDTGLAVTGTKAFLDGMSEELNVNFTYTVLTQTDEAQNLTKIQELISSGVDGIISTMDLGMPSIMDEAEAAGVYVAGYLSDFDTSYTSHFSDVYESEYFLGTAIDGHASDDVQVGKNMFDSLIEYNEANPSDPLLHVSMAIFPIWAFPSQTVAANQFVELVEEYNETAAEPITVDPLDEETDVLPFTPLSSTYFQKHPGIDAIISFAAGQAFVYPTMVSSGVDDEIKLLTSGFEDGLDTNFGSNGTQTVQHTQIAAVESVVFPLVLLLNQLRGEVFEDMPATAERINVEPIIINSDADLNKFKTNVYFTGDYEDSMLTAEDVLNLTAYHNEDATYADLVEVLSNLTIDDIE